MSDYDVKAIDAVVNIFNAEALSHRPDWKDLDEAGNLVILQEL